MANPNPAHRLTGDCVIRAISIAENKTWDDVFVELMTESFYLKDVPSSNNAWGTYLHNNGYTRKMVDDVCPYCTVEDFTQNHSDGTYILGTGTHVIAVKDGSYYDTWDSGQEHPVYYFQKGE